MAKLTTLRNLAVKPALNGFASGVSAGMSATNDVFDVPLLRLSADPYRGLRQDMDVLRDDVRRAKEKLAREFSR